MGRSQKFRPEFSGVYTYAIMSFGTFRKIGQKGVLINHV